MRVRSRFRYDRTMRETEQGSRIPWAWIGCGCGVLVLVLLMAVGGAAWFGVRTVQDLKHGLEDPEARRAKALEVLRTDSLPEPYEAILALEIPFFLEMAALSDGPVPEGEPDEVDFQADRLLLLVRLRDFGGEQRPQIRRFLEGESTDLELEMDMDVDLDVRLEERIGGGELDLGDGSRVRWRADLCEYTGEDGNALDGVHVVFLGVCPVQDRVDFGFWIRPLEDASEPEKVETDLRELLGSFVLCPER